MVSSRRDSSLLLVTILVALCHSSFAEERPVWTWKCKESRCEKVLLQEDDDNPTSLEVCKIFCDKYASLWPRPTGVLHLGSIMVPINPYSVSVEISGSGQLDQKVRDLAREAGRIFQQQLTKLAKLQAKGQTSGKSLFVSLNIKNTSVFRLESDTDESYELNVSETSDGRVNVSIAAATFFGARHGLETLHQLVIFDDITSGLVIPKDIRITDHPVFPHRGILLDTARSYFPVESIKRTIDGMAANKLNTFHWHITDSQSFPFQSTSYPEFSRYGAYSPSKIYTPSDIRSIVEYGRVRGVRVVPEFDEPAHVGEGWQWVGKNTTVCFKAEPWMDYCVEPPCGQLNPTSDKVYELLGGIYKDMLQVFDSDIFHMGGDEVNLNCWNTSAVIVEWMNNNNFSRTEDGFMDLWEMFQNRAYSKLVEANEGKELPVVLWTSGLTAKGKLHKHLDKDKYIIQIWTLGYDEIIAELVNKGFRVIFSNYDALYFDCGFGAWVGEGNNWCSPYIGWQKVYDNDLLKLLTKLGVDVQEGSHARSLVLGSEATLFSEQADETVLDSRLWPRAAAMAERLWSNPSDTWKAAEYRMINHRERLVQRGLQADTLQPEWCHQNEGYCYL